MRVKTPLGLFVTIVGVGLAPAAGVGSVIGVSYKDYDPIPQPSSSAEVWENMGRRNPTAEATGRVESREPREPAPTSVKPTTVKLYKTPHAEVNDVEQPEAPAASPESTPKADEPAPTKPADEHNSGPRPKPTHPSSPEPVDTPPATREASPEPVASDDQSTPKNS